MTVESSGRSAGWRDWAKLLRPKHWAKNVFVLAPLLFSGRATEPTVVASAVLVLVAFCLAASAVYAFNDVIDCVEDRAHPVKRHRPVAAGRIEARGALAAAALLVALSLSLAAVAGWLTLACIGGYLALNVAYSKWLKHMVLLDVFTIATFFLLRLLAGSVAVHVRPSVWLLLCGGLLALYLGFAKRRHELLVLGDESAGHRKVLTQYSPAFLDQISAVLLAVTLVSYLMYSLTSDTALKVGSEALSYGIPFVLYGVFRYLYLVHQKELGSPTETVSNDRPLMVTLILWLLYNAWVVYRPH
ncbi:MAG: decaprenyl-phosphate phosphoribosyltransferase [Gemmatimonadales bacterium]